MSETTHFGLPLIEAGQAQKHITHNEAVTVVDTLLHLAVKSRALASPPATPAEGDRYLVAASPAGAWAGHAGELAYWQAGAWLFMAPRSGWRTWLEDEMKLIVFDGTVWRDAGTVSELQDLALLGVHATADLSNRLTVSSPATLLTHQGSGHQLKINKNAAADTASLLFQDGFSGRAEIGLAGDDDLRIKVSADGTSWTEALHISRSTGRLAAPQGLADNTVTNAALADMAAGRIKGTVTAGDPADLTGTQATALLDTFTSTLKGLAPASGGGTINFLRADGSWAVPAGGGGGEANTASNVNAGGVGVFRQKTGVDLEFRGINAGSAKVTVSLDTPNNEIDIDIAEANLTLGNIGGSIDLGGSKASGTLAAARFPALTGDVTTSAGSLATTIASNAVTTAKIAANQVTDAKLRQGAATSVIGRSAGTSGDVADIAASADNQVLNRSSGALAWSLLSGSSLNNSTVQNSKLATMAAATIKGNNTAGTANPSDLTASQVTAMLDTFTNGAKGLAPASGGGTTNFLRADGSWAAPPGGGGGSGDVVGPAGATDNAVARFDGATGKLVQASAVGIDDDGSVVVPVIAAPATPSPGQLALFAEDVGGRALLSIRGPSGLSTPLQPLLGRNKIAWLLANGNSTSISTMGFAASNAGTATARNVATTGFFTSVRRIGFVSATTAGSSAGTRSAALQYWRGNAAGLGGFLFIARFGVSDAAAVSDSRLAAGLFNTASAIGNVNPSTLTHMVMAGTDNGQTNLRIMHNDGSGTATAIDLGASFPAQSLSTDMYEVTFFCPPNGSAITYRVERLNTGDVTSGTLSTDLPGSATLLSPQIWRNNGATALAVGIDVASLYVETDL